MLTQVPDKISVRLTPDQWLTLMRASDDLSRGYPELGVIKISQLIGCAITCMADQLNKGQGLPKPD